ncbi:MAG: SGNH/GDSL hydrolase family protein [Clostridia bacterium]|nr:SGNH/GDSL hydrolase family protein [Clostridia bacterium]
MQFHNGLKITVFGDSIGKGITTDNGKIEKLSSSAVEIFEQEYGVKVDNRSIYGQSLKRICQKGLIDKYINEISADKQNVAVLELGGNDADFDWKRVGSEPGMNHTPQTPIKEFSSLYGETVKKLKNAGVKVVACSIVPIDSERFFNKVIASLTDKSRVMEFFRGDFNTIHRHQEMFNNEILKNAYANGVGVIDLRQKFLDTNDFEGLMCQDGIHPNSKGHCQIYNAVNEFLATY